MSIARRYQVVLVNCYEEGVDLDLVKAAFAKQFKLSRAVVERLFAQDMHVVKKGLDAETAARYKVTIDELGANCRIEYMPQTQGIREKRREGSERRQAGDRRGRLRDTIQPDRRARKDRRRPQQD